MTAPAPDSFPRLRARTQRFTLGEPRTVTVCADGSRVLFLRSAAGDDRRTGLWALDLPGGDERVVVEAADDGALSTAERARRERTREGAAGVVAYAADTAGRVVAVALGGRLQVADLDTGELRPLPGTEGGFDPRPDPTGRRVAYVMGSQLRVADADGTADVLVAGDSDEQVSWGRAEFVAAEEMDRLRGYWWAPDGSALLAARVDESAVQQWWIADPAHPGSAPRAVRYPAAGTANADVSLWLLEPGADTRTEIRWDRERCPYLGRVHWSSAGPPLLAVVSRDQRSVATLAVDLGDGSTTVHHEDTDPAWVELFSGVPAWCGTDIVRIVDVGDARRLFIGERAVTPEDMYVRSVVGTDVGQVVLTASAGDPTRVDVYRWSAAGLERLSDGDGVHGASMGGGTVVLATASLERDGTRFRVLTADDDRPLASYAVTSPVTPEVRMLRLGSRQLSAGLLLPRDHRAGSPLPVLLDPYGGPHAQRVMAARRLWLEPQWLADQGFAVLVIDGRGSPGRDPAWDRAVHRDLAGPVIEDQVEGLREAARLEPDLDLTRVGIRGWSFGGYLAALAVLRRPDVFAAAIAGAPVTDWTMYDTFYTERYLGTPQEQPEAYRRSSLLDDAPSLERPLLLIHGLADDNVVAAHTLRLSQRLTESGRAHQVLPLTGVSHMTPQEVVAENLLLLQVEFLKRHLTA